MGLLQEKLAKYDLPQKFMAQGVYPYFREIEGKQGTHTLALREMKELLKQVYKPCTSMVPVVPVHVF